MRKAFYIKLKAVQVALKAIYIKRNAFQVRLKAVHIKLKVFYIKLRAVLVGLKAVKFSLLFLISFAVSHEAFAQSDSLIEGQDDWLEINKTIAYTHIVPLYESLAKSTGKLADSINSLCDAEGDVVLSEKVKKHFSEAYLNWSKVQHIKFGPVSFLKRYERIQYWPDKHNASERQVRKLLNAIDEGEQYTAFEFQKKSVAVQGFTTLERMLFSSDDIINKQECKLANYVAENIRTITGELDSNWRLAPVEYANEFELAGREAGTYSSSDEVIAILANAFATQLTIISEYKLGRALPKKEGGRTFPRKMEAWRSELSLDMALASIKSLKSFYILAFKNQLQIRNKELGARIETQFDRVLVNIKETPRPMVSVIESEAGVMAVMSLKSDVEALEKMVRSELFPELGFAVRFNSLDGD